MSSHRSIYVQQFYEHVGKSTAKARAYSTAPINSHLIHRCSLHCQGPGRWKIKRWYIYLRLDIDARFTAEQLEQAFSDAEELEIEYFQPAYGYGDNGTLKLFEGIRGVGLAKVIGGSGCDAEYARSLEAMLMTPMHTAARS
ncbi:hypothetical protein E4T45_00597 [Aureobasidium sp. EXF-8846]|nr:hypothetical protein E4T45_00597 [Aureobasidium sp. EXF-8846]